MEAHVYEAMARLEGWYWWYAGLRRLVCRMLRSHLDRSQSFTILDAGCGTGGGMTALHHAFPASLVLGVDLSPNALHYAAGDHAGRIVRGSVNALPYRDRAFDVVVSTDVLYIRGVDDALASREAYRVLRPGGLLAVNVPAFEWLAGEHDAAVQTRHRYTRSEVLALLTEAGFTVKRVMYWNAVLFPVAWVVRRLLRPNARVAHPRSDLRPLPWMINRCLVQILAFDTWLCSKIGVAFGTSAFALMAKPS